MLFELLEGDNGWAAKYFDESSEKYPHLASVPFKRKMLMLLIFKKLETWQLKSTFKTLNYVDDDDTNCKFLIGFFGALTH